MTKYPIACHICSLYYYRVIDVKLHFIVYTSYLKHRYNFNYILQTYRGLC